MLIVLSGRPGTGKTSVAQEICRRLGACYLRVDAAETALARTGATVGIGGYAVIHELAVSNLQLGLTVVVDAVSPVPEARRSWREAAARVGVPLLSLETVVPDRAEHRRRVEARAADIPGHRVPTWDEVERGEWTAWDEDRDGPRLVLDATDTRSAVDRALSAVCGDPPSGL